MFLSNDKLHTMYEKKKEKFINVYCIQHMEYIQYFTFLSLYIIVYL